jgi:poly(3-hydroxyalkanoate) synthetase
MPGGKKLGADWTDLLLPGVVAAEAGALFARHMMEAFASPAPSPEIEPDWASENTIALEIGAARLRRFAGGEGRPLIVCAPFSAHGAQIADLCPGHSLMQVLRGVGAPLYLVEWRSASADQAGRRIDDYLADLNVFIDELGGVADFVGLCQGGWLSLIYAARFPAKAGRLVLAGAPIDIEAGESRLSALAHSTSLETFRDLVALGGGRARGDQASRFWRSPPETADAIHKLFQSDDSLDSLTFQASIDAFRRWQARTLDLPGGYYLEVVEAFYKNNALAHGDFVALGKRIDLRALRHPVFLLAARDDEITAPEQAFACARLVGTPADSLCRRSVPGGHIELFIGAKNLQDIWPEVVAWIQRNPAQNS